MSETRVACVMITARSFMPRTSRASWALLVFFSSSSGTVEITSSASATPACCRVAVLLMSP